MVNVVNDRFHVACSRCGDYDFFSARRDVLFSAFFSREETCALQNDVNAELSPRKFFRVAVSQNFYVLAVYFEEAVVYFDFAVEFALSCIIFQQVSEHFRIGQVVDCDNLDTLHVLNAAESQTSDTTKSVNSYFYSH